MNLATLSGELAVVSLVVLVLFLASLVAMAPLRRIRLPFTVAILLTGFALGWLALGGAPSRSSSASSSRSAGPTRRSCSGAASAAPWPWRCS